MPVFFRYQGFHPGEFGDYSVGPPPDNQIGFGGMTYDSTGFVIDNPAAGLWTTSPPMVMRLIDDTHWTLAYGTWNLPGQLDYVQKRFSGDSTTRRCFTAPRSTPSIPV